MECKVTIDGDSELNHLGTGNSVRTYVKGNVDISTWKDNLKFLMGC